MSGPKRVIVFVVVIAVGALITFLFSGCAMFSKRPKISSPAATVVGSADGKNATLDSASSVATLPLPAGSTLVMTKIEPMRAIPATDQTPAQAAQPAKEVVEVKLAGPTEWRKTETAVKADTGVIDTTVAVKRMEIAERQLLLLAAIGCGIVGLIARSTLPQWPAVSNGFLAAAVAAGIAWKFAEVPWWLFLLILGLVGTLVLGYKRREKDEREEAANVNPTSPTPKVVS